jgi:dienelactone hydrolase
MKLVDLMSKTMICAALLIEGCDDGSDAIAEAKPRAADKDEEPGSEPVPGGPGETVDVTIPASLHAQGIELPAKLVRPKSSKGGKGPAVMVLHGSGGLLKDGSGKGDQPCSSQMESQYSEWADRLSGLGYTVLLPSSYSARGFCDKHKDAMPKNFDDKPEQIISRIYDTDAASRYLCDLEEVDCERMGVIGFSQGGTMVMLALHWQVEHALSYFRKTKGKDVDIEIPDLKPGRPEFKMGIAYYPGCGFDGAVPLSTSGSLENMYSPTGPLTILHGSKDSLLKHCSTEHGSGGRQTQSKKVADELRIEDLYEIIVYDGASHSFDSSGSKNPGDANKGADGAARVAALKVALERLGTQL